MADKSIEQLNAAENVYLSDLFVLQQSGTAKKLTGQVLKNWLLELAQGHGGITSIALQSTSGLDKTYRITLADDTYFDMTVSDGKGIATIAKVSVSGLVDTYRITYNDNTTSTFTITNGAKGDKGDNAYVWIRYAAQKPTAASHSFGVLPDNWIGVYSGNSATAPTDWTQYQWFEIKGEKGDTGNPATLNSSTISYQTSDSGTVVPSGTWSNTIPTVTQGKYLWTRVTLAFNTGSAVTSYSVSRMGIDGTGAVSKVCGKGPNSSGNVILDTSDIGALSSSGGQMTGDIAMTYNQIKLLGAPTEAADAATKSYVDTAFNNARTILETTTLTVAGWTGSTAPYTQQVTVSALTGDKFAMAYPVYDSDVNANLALKEACGMVSFASRGDHKITFTCLEDKPTVDIPIAVEVYV